MEHDYEAHEVLRIFQTLLSDFLPAPRGDWGWLIRKLWDVDVRGVRAVTKVYDVEQRAAAGWVKIGEEFQDRAMHISRLLLEEALRRTLMHGDPLDKMSVKAQRSLMVTLRTIEISSVGGFAGNMSLFRTFTPENVKRVAHAVLRQESTMRGNASFDEVLRQADLKFEIVSLMGVKVEPEAIAMTQPELKHPITTKRQKVADYGAAPGITGDSGLFEDIFE